MARPTDSVNASDALVAFLRAPRRIGEVAIHLGVSRQAASKRLQRLQREGRIIAAATTAISTRKAYVCRTDPAKSDARRPAAQDTSPDDPSARLLSRCHRDEPVDLQTLTRASSAAPSITWKTLQALVVAGLLWRFTLVGQTFFLLTESGATSPWRDIDAPPAEPADLRALLGERRLSILEALADFGPSPTPAFSALVRDADSPHRTVLVAQGLAKLAHDDLIRSTGAGRARLHRLTDKGFFILQLMADRPRRVEARPETAVGPAVP